MYLKNAPDKTNLFGPKLLLMSKPRPIILLNFVFSNTKFTGKAAGFNGIRTRIVSVQCKHADHSFYLWINILLV